MPFDSTPSRRLINSPPPEALDDEAIEAFARLVRATRRRDLRSGLAEGKRLRSLGWSCVPTRVKGGDR